MPSFPLLAAGLLEPSLIESMLAQGPAERRDVADALAVLGDRSYYRYLFQLLDDPHASVRERAMAAAAKTGSREFVPALLAHLADRGDRVTARQALAAYGDTIAGTLSDYLKDAEERIEVRHEIPRVLSLIRTQPSADVLLETLPQSDEPLRYQILKALNKLRSSCPDLNLDRRVETALTQEAQSYYELLSDHVRIAEAILRVLARRLRALPIALAPKSLHRRRTLQLEECT